MVFPGIIVVSDFEVDLCYGGVSSRSYANVGSSVVVAFHGHNNLFHSGGFSKAF